MSDTAKSKSKEKKSSKSVKKKTKSSKELPVDTSTDQHLPTNPSKSENAGKTSDSQTPSAQNNTTSNINLNNNQYYDQIAFKNQRGPGQGQGLDNTIPHHHDQTQLNQGNMDKCDGCYEGEGMCYCVTCGKTYCKICNDQIHIVPSYRNHERHPLTEVSHLRKLCYHHNNTLKFFCESCEEPICQDCQMIGPHNNKLHRITSVFESFRKKFAYLSNLIQKSLLMKYDQTMTQVQYLEYLVEQVKKVKNGIEREIRGDYAAMIDNLNSVEGKKLAVLNYESSILQKELNKMQEIITYVNDVSGNESPDMLSFLLRYKQTNEMIEFCLAKPPKEKVEIRFDDFPRELEETKLKLKQLAQMERLVKVKDEIIWKVINDKRKGGDFAKEMTELKEKSKNEISEWAKLSDKYEMELQKYNLVCDFCGNFLDDHTVNTNCDKNTSVNSKGSFGMENCPIDFIGTKRHFFTQPSKDFDKKIKKEIKSAGASLNTCSGVNNPFEHGTNPTNTIAFNDWVIILSNKITKEGFDLSKALNEYDSDMDGLLSQKELQMSLKGICAGIVECTQNDIDYLLTSLAIFNKDSININVFIDNLLKISQDS